jgi:predicted DNA-binding transcriptional regulator YafY
MPTDNTASTLVRILDMLRSLPRAGSGATADELLKKLQEKGYEVQKRTIERDLKTLRQAFGAYIKCNDKSKPYGWRWHDDAEFEVVAMSVTEALSLQAIDEAIKPLLPASVLASLKPRFKQARTLLTDLSPKNKHASWAQKVRSVQPGLPMRPPHIEANVLAVVQECLLSDECIKVQYQSAGSDAPKERLLHPLALVQRGPVTYLIAMTNDYVVPFLYAVHRIQQAERTYLSARTLPGFDIDQYIAEGHLQFGDQEATGEEIKLEAIVADGLMKILMETPISADQELNEKNGRWWVKATLRDTRQLQWWVLSQGASIEVRSPKSLRIRVGESLRLAAALYTE